VLTRRKDRFYLREERQAWGWVVASIRNYCAFEIGHQDSLEKKFPNSRRGRRHLEERKKKETIGCVRIL
jgi:hypothetical protein